MKKVMIFLLATAFVIMAAGNAFSCLFDITDYTNVWFNSNNTSYTWDFNIDNLTDVSADDTIDFASFQMGIYDDFDWSTESGTVSAGSSTWGFDYLVGGQLICGNVTSLLEDHFLSITVNWESGDFGVGFTHLWGVYTDNSDTSSTAPVPEPATILLLGFGLAGMAGISRKKIAKKM